MIVIGSGKFADLIGQAAEYGVLAELQLTYDSQTVYPEEHDSYAAIRDDFINQAIAASGKPHPGIRGRLINGCRAVAQDLNAKVAAEFQKALSPEIRNVDVTVDMMTGWMSSRVGHVGGTDKSGDVRIGDMTVEVKFYSGQSVKYLTTSDRVLFGAENMFLKYLKYNAANTPWKQGNDGKDVVSHARWIEQVRSGGFVGTYIKYAAQQLDETQAAQQLFTYVLQKGGGNGNGNLNKDYIYINQKKGGLEVSVDLDGLVQWLSENGTYDFKTASKMSAGITWRGTAAARQVMTISAENFASTMNQMIPWGSAQSKAAQVKNINIPLGLRATLTGGFHNLAREYIGAK